MTIRPQAHLVIAGGGASALLLCLQLLRQGVPVNITVVEKQTDFGIGLAYRTPYDFHILNVRAANMSVFPDEPSNFTDWLAAKKLPYKPEDFVPRKIFGEYLRETAARIEKQIRLLHDEVIHIKGHTVELASGNRLDADVIVLAPGNFLPNITGKIGREIYESPKFIRNPWDYAIISRIEPDSDVLIIGSGLTMTDVLLLLQSRNHSGRIISLSVHGFAPEKHGGTDRPAEGFAIEVRAAEDIITMFRIWRKYLAAGHPPESLVAAIRPYVQEIWLRLSITDRRRFTEHLRHYWGTVRHRVPANCFATVKKMDRLEIIAGRIVQAEKNGDDFIITYSPRRSREAKVLRTQYIINCTGPSLNYEKDAPEFLKKLIADKQVIRDPLRLGLQASPEGRLTNQDGRKTQKLYAIGNLMRGVLWEITSVPDIRKQAEVLAAAIKKDLEEKDQ